MDYKHSFLSKGRSKKKRGRVRKGERGGKQIKGKEKGERGEESDRQLRALVTLLHLSLVRS